MTDDTDKLTRILETRMSFKWPYRVDIETATFNDNSTEIQEWCRSSERLGHSVGQPHHSYSKTTFRMYVNNQHDWMEFCLRWK